MRSERHPVVPRVPGVSSQTWSGGRGSYLSSLRPPQEGLGDLEGLQPSWFPAYFRGTEGQLLLCNPGLCQRVQEAASGSRHRITLFVICPLWDPNGVGRALGELASHREELVEESEFKSAADNTHLTTQMKRANSSKNANSAATQYALDDLNMHAAVKEL